MRADEHDAEARRPSDAFRKRGDARAQLFTKRRRERGAIK